MHSWSIFHHCDSERFHDIIKWFTMNYGSAKEHLNGEGIADDQ